MTLIREVYLDIMNNLGLGLESSSFSTYTMNLVGQGFQKLEP